MDQKQIYIFCMRICRVAGFRVSKVFKILVIKANLMLLDAEKENFLSYINTGQINVLESRIIKLDVQSTPFLVNLFNTQWSLLNKVGEFRSSGSRGISINAIIIRNNIKEYAPCHGRKDYTCCLYLCGIKNIQRIKKNLKYIFADTRFIERMCQLLYQGHSLYHLQINSISHKLSQNHKLKEEKALNMYFKKIIWQFCLGLSHNWHNPKEIIA